MNKQGFSVTFETITPESAEHGDVEERGYIVENASLRDALSDFQHEGCHVVADSSPVHFPRGFTAYCTNDGARNYYEQGITENRSLHIPDHITAASRLRIARLVDCYGI